MCTFQEQFYFTLKLLYVRCCGVSKCYMFQNICVNCCREIVDFRHKKSSEQVSSLEHSITTLVNSLFFEANCHTCVFFAAWWVVELFSVCGARVRDSAARL